tara:strand:- start:4661 stop:4897 length:237 start_codon:yes stop_codon:yes gene_type:complete
MVHPLRKLNAKVSRWCEAQRSTGRLHLLVKFLMDSGLGVVVVKTLLKVRVTDTFPFKHFYHCALGKFDPNSFFSSPIS